MINKRLNLKNTKPLEDNVISDIKNNNERTRYINKKKLYKDEYIKVINNDIEILECEKSRVKSKMYNGSLPHFSITASIVITILIVIIQLCNTYLYQILDNENSKVILPFIITVISLVGSFLCIFKPVEEQRNKLMNCHMRLEILEELEKDLRKNGFIVNKEDEDKNTYTKENVDKDKKIATNINKLFTKKNKYNEMLYEITDIKLHMNYLYLRENCMNIYLHSLSSKESIHKEKERIINALETLKLPYYNLSVSIFFSFISIFIGFGFAEITKDITSPIFEIFILFISLIIFVVVYLMIIKLLNENTKRENKVKLYNLCLQVLDEMEFRIDTGEKK